MKKKNKLKNKGVFSVFRSKVEDTNFGHNAELNRNLDSYAVKLIKAVGIVGVILGCLILIAFWVWVIRWLYKIW
jgi:magnesium-transporting ATPase (P-type)